MSFFTDFIRVAGVIAAPVLISTGVGTPLGLAIGAVATAGTNLAADAIENKEARNQADQQAAQARAEADARIAQQAADARVEQARREAEINRQLEQAALPERVLTACRNGNIAELNQLLSRLSDRQFTELGTNLIAVCPSQEIRQQVINLRQAEIERRGL